MYKLQRRPSEAIFGSSSQTVVRNARGDALALFFGLDEENGNLLVNLIHEGALPKKLQYEESN